MQSARTPGPATVTDRPRENRCPVCKSFGVTGYWAGAPFGEYRYWCRHCGWSAKLV